MQHLLKSLRHYSDALGSHFPFNCGNLLVATQYLLPLSTILNYVQPGEALLDWGSGKGHLSHLLLQQGLDVHSYPYSEHEDPVKLPFAAGSFKAVISIGVLEHVRETGGDEHLSMQEIYRILKPSGYFLCFHFPNRYSWIEALSRTLRPLTPSRYVHPYLYTKQQIQAFAQAASFKLVDVNKYQLLPRRTLRKVPSFIAQQNWPSLFYLQLEKYLSKALGSFSQNYYFVCQK